MSDSAMDSIYLTKKYSREEFLPTDLWREISKIDDDFTLYDLFRLVWRANTIIPGICVAFGMPKFDAFWNQINLNRELDDTDDIEYLELYWNPDYDIRTTKKTGKSTNQKSITGLDDGNKNYWDNPKICKITNLMSFHGIGPGCPLENSHKCNDNCPKATPYGIWPSPINNLAHLPIRVSPKVEFYPPFVESDHEFKRTDFELTINPTLWCFIVSILWELTFAGSTPRQVADHIQEISDRGDNPSDS